MTRLSVVVPAYNNADYIAATMDSILEQDYDDFELIVSDHSSTDGTVAVLARYTADPRVTLISTEAGGGAQRNWQRVTDAATGELLKLVCGDDLLYPGALRSQVEAFDRSPDAVLVASRRDILDAVGSPFIAARGLDGLEGEHDGAEAVRRSVRGGTNLLGEPACVTFRRSALVASGGWDGRDGYLIDQASYAAVLLAPGATMVGLAGPHAGFRVNSGQWSVALAADQSRQARRFHRRVRQEHPGVVSGADVAIGDVRATVLSLARRAVYIVFASRLRPPVPQATTE